MFYLHFAMGLLEINQFFEEVGKTMFVLDYGPCFT